jgi:hypothetical protein
MILYHGSDIAIDKIDLSKCNPNKDFGQGFYLTDLKQQAQDMAIRRTRMTGQGAPTISMFEFDEAVLKENTLNIKVFPSVSVEWAQFVLNNRDIQRAGFSHNYDIVVGPVADDTVAFQLRRYLLGVISLENLVKELTYKKLSNQYFFGTEKAISKLRRTHE